MKRGPRILDDDQVAPFVRFFRKAERDVRARCSEYWRLQLHDKLYLRLRCNLDPLRLCMAARPATQRLREKIKALFHLLDTGAKERLLQEALVDSGLLVLNGRSYKEVGIAASQHAPAMRMDLVLAPLRTDEPVQILELKRGSHRLLAYGGTSKQRKSRALVRAVAQVASYGNRLASGDTAAVDVGRRYGIPIKRPELWLIAGRRLPSPDAYDLLPESDGTNSTPRLLIYTWDGYLAELEHIVG